MRHRLLQQRILLRRRDMLQDRLELQPADEQWLHHRDVLEQPVHEQRLGQQGLHRSSMLGQSGLHARVTLRRCGRLHADRRNKQLLYGIDDLPPVTVLDIRARLHHGRHDLRDLLRRAVVCRIRVGPCQGLRWRRWLRRQWHQGRVWEQPDLSRRDELSHGLHAVEPLPKRLLLRPGDLQPATAERRAMLERVAVLCELLRGRDLLQQRRVLSRRLGLLSGELQGRDLFEQHLHLWQQHRPVYCGRVWRNQQHDVHVAQGLR